MFMHGQIQRVVRGRRERVATRAGALYVVGQIFHLNQYGFYSLNRWQRNCFSKTTSPTGHSLEVFGVPSPFHRDL